MLPTPGRQQALIVLLLATIGPSAVAQGRLPSDEPLAGYSFFLDGDRFSPEVVSVMGLPGEPAPGDLIGVNGFMMTLGDEHEYRFRSAPEGLRLETPDGRTRWVAVRVGPDYHGDRGFVDGMEPLAPDEVNGLWSLRAETWTPSCVMKAPFLDVSRVHLELGQSAIEGDDSLPKLPSGLRYLDAMRFTGWKELTRLSDLVYLSLLPEKEFDVRTIAQLQRLRVLKVLSGTLTHPDALAQLAALEQLDLSFHDEITEVGFAAGLSRLRELQIERTRIRDLGPLARLTGLASVDARRSRVERLPEGALPALRYLNVVGARVTARAAAAFRGAHPSVIVRHGWNESLREALREATRVRVEPDQGCGSDSVPPPYESIDAEELRTLISLMRVDEKQSGGICGCLGGPVLKFFDRDRLLESVQVVCIDSLRWSDWPGDGTLPPRRARLLLEWLASRGVSRLNN